MDILKKHIDILGLKVRDKFTGFEGVCECVSFDLYGCVQVTVKPPVKDGELKDAKWFDIHRLDVICSDVDRVMTVPSFAGLATQEGVHQHGPAEKPIR